MALATLLSLVVAHPAAVGAVLLAGIAVLQRWGTPSLDAIAGAQSVLGPGGVVGPQAAAASAWFAAIALVLATPRPTGDDGDGAGDADGARRRPGAGTLVAALALGAAAGAVVAGPDFGEDLLLRLGATAAAVLLAVVVASLRRQDVTATLALVAGIIAAALATGVASGRVGL